MRRSISRLRKRIKARMVSSAVRVWRGPRNRSSSRTVSGETRTVVVAAHMTLNVYVSTIYAFGGPGREHRPKTPSGQFPPSDGGASECPSHGSDRGGSLLSAGSLGRARFALPVAPARSLCWRRAVGQVYAAGGAAVTCPMPGTVPGCCTRVGRSNSGGVDRSPRAAFSRRESLSSLRSNPRNRGAEAGPPGGVAPGPRVARGRVVQEAVQSLATGDAGEDREEAVPRR